MENCTRKEFETPEIEIYKFREKDAILTESNDDLGGWSPDII